MTPETAKVYLAEALGVVAEVLTGKPFHVELTGPRVEIRCCCDPTKLYGWLPLNGEPIRGQRFVFPIPPKREACDLSRVPADETSCPVIPGGEVLLEVDVLTVGSFQPITDGRESYPALKYHGDHLSFVEKLRQLRHVPGFEPSPEARALLRDPVWP